MINISIAGNALQEIQADESLFKKALSQAVWSGVVAATPVDSGKARASWKLDGSGAGTQIPDGEYGYPSMPSVPLRGDVHIYNTAPYTAFLNDGHSQQAPSMFVEIAIESAIRSVRNVIR